MSVEIEKCKECGIEYNLAEGHCSIESNLCLDCWAAIWKKIEARIAA